MNQMTKPAASTADNTSSSLARNDASSDEIQPLNDVFVTLESIQPGVQPDFLSADFSVKHFGDADNV